MTFSKLGRWYSLGALAAIAILFVMASNPSFTFPKWFTAIPHLLVLSGAVLFLASFLRLLGEIRKQDSSLSLSEFQSTVLRNTTVHFWFISVFGAIVLLIAATSLARGPDVTPSIVNGVYVDAPHGRVIREITEQEYATASREILRMFTGIDLVFAWGLVCLFWWSRYDLAYSQRLKSDPHRPV